MNGDEVFLTGATGFVGSHVRAALLDAGYCIRALVRAQARPIPPDDRCRTVIGDLRATGELVRSMEGCRYLVHVAARYAFAAGERAALYPTNVRGTAGLLEAARLAGIELAVVTSSSGTVGPARSGRPATEADRADEHETASDYHGSKVQEERAALAAQVPVVLVLPTAPVGPGDWKPTPTGKMIVDFMKGRIVATLPGGLNLAPVEDVGRAHVLALERGRPGERYLIGGENLSLHAIWNLLAGICHRRAPAYGLPYRLALTVGWLDELRCRLRPQDQPLAPLEGVRMGRELMYISDQKARTELGYTSTSTAAALERAVRWYHDHDYA